eukprot:218882_1
MATTATELNLLIAGENAMPKQTPFTKNEEDRAAPSQLQPPMPSRVASAPDGSITNSLSPVQRRFSTTNIDTENKTACDPQEMIERAKTEAEHKLIEYLWSKTIKPIHDTRLLCYIYDGGKINGPHTCDEIIALYVYNQIQDDIIYIASANQKRQLWHKLEIPPRNRPSEMSMFAFAQEYLDKNIEIKENFPELYDGLIINVLTHKTAKITPPLKIPEDVQKCKSVGFSFVSFLGKLVAFVALVIMLLHLLPFIPLSFVYLVMLKRFRDKCIKSRITARRFYSIVYIVMFCGFVATPIVVTWILLTKLRLYDEIQSWMIAYIAWGIFSFMVAITYSVLLFVLSGTKQKKYVNAVNKILFFIVAIDFGALDVVSMLTTRNVSFYDIFRGKAMGLVTLVITMPIACLLPAAVGGFIANYILAEKFELKCSANIVNTNICFDSLEYGCCEVISSHNWMNSYAFMGRFASNILAVWAIIRICGYLLANARSDYAIHAKRTK